MNKVRKALVAAAAAALTAVAEGMVTSGIEHVNWGVVIGAALAAGFATWRIPNASA